MLAGQYEHAGTLGELVVQADQASVSQELGGNPSKAITAPKHSLQRKLLDGLRYLLKEELKLNQSQASDGWLTQDALWLVSKTVSDKLRAHLLSQGIDGIPANNIAVFNVLQDHGVALSTPGHKAIWKATVTSDSGWSSTFTFLKLSPALIWEASERPAAFTGTVDVVPDENQVATDPASAAAPDPLIDARPARSDASTRPGASVPVAVDGIDDLLGLLRSHDSQRPAPKEPLADEPEPEPVPATTSVAPVPASTPIHEAARSGTPSGEHFVAWLRQGLQSHRLILNDAKALVHTVADTAYLVSPGVFQRYVQEHPQVAALAKQEKLAEWRWVQKQFERLRLHRKQDSGLNIWTCEVTGPRKSRRLHGYLLTEPTQVLGQVIANNPYLKLIDSKPAVDV